MDGQTVDDGSGADDGSCTIHRAAPSISGLRDRAVTASLCLSSSLVAGSGTPVSSHSSVPVD